MASYYATYLGIDGLEGGGRTPAEQRADDLMDEGGQLTEAIVAFEALGDRNEVTVVRHAACLAWARRAEEAIAMLDASGATSLPAQAVLSEAWFMLGADWTHPEHGARRSRGWEILLPVLDARTPPWLAFATLERNYMANRELDKAKVADWFATAIRLYPVDERFHLAAESILPFDNTAERIAGLKVAWETIPSARVATRLAFVLDRAGQHGEAAHFLAKGEALEEADTVEGAVLGVLRVLRVEQLVRQGDARGALDVAQSIDLVGLDPLIGPRARLVAACALGDPALVLAHAQEFVAILDQVPSISDWELLKEEVTSIKGAGWSDGELTQETPDLSRFRTMLLGVADDYVRGWMQYLFAVHDFREADSGEGGAGVDWRALADIVGDAAGVVRAPRILCFDAAVRLRLKGTQWRVMGRQWIEGMLAVQASGADDASPSIVDLLVATPTRAATFLRGVDDGLKSAAPAPHAFDAIDAGLEGIAENPLLKREMASILKRVGASDPRPEVQFLLGYVLHRTDPAAALRAYGRVLEAEPGNTSALFNALLLCTGPTHAEIVRRMAKLVDNLDEDVGEERRGELAGALERAMKACIPAEVPGSPLARMLADFPALQTSMPAAASVPLRSVVALIALLRSAPSDADPLLLQPLTKGTTPFSPTQWLRHLLFGALGSGLVTIGEATPAEAVVIKDGTWSCYTNQLWWRLSPAAFGFVAEARAQRPVSSWPVAWQRQVLDLARDIAVDECVQYVCFLCEERDWPEPAATDKLRDLSREMIDRFSVSRAYYLFYLGAMAASDRKERFRQTGQHASNTLVVAAAERFASARAGKYGDDVRAYHRSHACPRSALSFALWSDLLDLGDAGFDDRISDVLGVSPVPG